MVSNKHLLKVIKETLEFNKEVAMEQEKESQEMSENRHYHKDVKAFHKGMAFGARTELVRINRLLEVIESADRKTSESKD